MVNLLFSGWERFTESLLEGHWMLCGGTVEVFKGFLFKRNIVGLLNG